MSACSCDFEPPEFADSRYLTARKEHACSECRRKIAPGERYRLINGKWDGDFLTYKRCSHCNAALEEIDRLAQEFDWCVCVSLGDAREILGDFVREERWPNTAPIGRVVVAMQRKWLRFDGSGLMDVSAVMRSEADQ